MSDDVLSVRGLDVEYRTPRGRLLAVRGVDLDLPRGTTLGLVGESGSGKSTLARAIAGIIRPARGTVRIDGGDGRRGVQMIFQNPYASLDPRMTVGESIGEGVIAGEGGRIGSAQTRRRVEELLDLVSLDAAVAERAPGELSGGQRQRIAIARAIAARPAVILADEVTSALDVSVQGSILNLLRRLQRELGLSILFISHDLAVVRHMSDRVLVMYCGEVVEQGAADAVTGRPVHPYTRGLIASIPAAVSGSAVSGSWLPAGDTADPMNPPSGCRFHPRCPLPRLDPSLPCADTVPGLEAAGAGAVRCLFADQLTGAERTLTAEEAVHAL